MNKQKPVSFTHPHSLTCKRWQLAKLLDMFLSKMALCLLDLPQKRWVIQLGVGADIAQFSPRSTTEFTFTKNTSNLSKGPYPNFSPAFSKQNPLGGHCLVPKALVGFHPPKKKIGPWRQLPMKSTLLHLDSRGNVKSRVCDD